MKLQELRAAIDESSALRIEANVERREFRYYRHRIEDLEKDIRVTKREISKLKKRELKFEEQRQRLANMQKWNKEHIYELALLKQ